MAGRPTFTAIVHAFVTPERAAALAAEYPGDPYAQQEVMMGRVLSHIQELRRGGSAQAEAAYDELLLGHASRIAVEVAEASIAPREVEDSGNRTGGQLRPLDPHETDAEP